MTIRGLEPFLNERKLTQTGPLSLLNDTRLGIDMSQYLKKLLTSELTREPMIAATGGLPLALITQVEADLRVLEKHRIKPVFVFQGLPVQRKPLPRAMQAHTYENDAYVKTQAWQQYELGNADAAGALLVKAVPRYGNWTDPRDVTRMILRIFRHRLVEHIVAPYLQYAQLLYMLNHPKAYVHSVYSSMDMLAFPLGPAAKVITHVDFQNATFSWVEKPRLLAELGSLSPDQFLDLTILSGFELCPTFPVFAQQFYLQGIIDTLRAHKTGLAVVQAYAKHPAVEGETALRQESYLDRFQKARACVRHSLVLTAEHGHVLPLSLALPPTDPSMGPPIGPGDVPSDLADVFSARLPDELYFHISRGFPSPALVGWLTTGTIIEPPPTCNGEATEYKKFIKDVITNNYTAPRCTALALLSSSLHAHWAQTRVAIHYYFDGPQVPPTLGTPVNFNTQQTRNLVERCLSWQVPYAIVEDELRRQNSSTIDFKLCLGATHTEEGAKRTRTVVPAKTQQPTPPPAAAKQLEKKDEIVANVIWRFLDLRGLQHPNHMHTAMGRALHAGIVASRVNDKSQEPLYLSLELARAGVLHGDLWSGVEYSGGPSFGDATEKRSLLLFMRCLSTVQLVYRNQSWSGPLSRELLVFNSFVKALSKSLRQLFEAISVHMLLRGDARKDRDNYVDISLSLPFQGDVNTGFGILGKTYVDATIAIFGRSVTEDDLVKEAERVQDAKSQAIAIVEETFVIVKNARQEIERGFRFWDALMVSVKSLAKDQGPTPAIQNIVMQPNVIEQFEVADKWLKPFRP